MLASASPRRRDLLVAAGLQVHVHPVGIDEARLHDEHPVHLARRLALGKATATQRALVGAGSELAELAILGADTVVHRRAGPGESSRQSIFDKPSDPQDARCILRSLSHRWHRVTTGFCILSGERRLLSHVTTRVRFRELSERLIRRYVATGEPLDKAGAYGIQGLGAVLVERVDGSYTNVVGLPVEAVAQALRQLGIPDPVQ